MNIHAIEEVKDADQDTRPVLAIRFGRGRTGGTTFLDFLIQRARRAGRGRSRSLTAIGKSRHLRASILRVSRVARFARAAKTSPM